MPFRSLLLLILLLGCSPLFAQTIRGEVVDMDDKSLVDGVTISNIYTSLEVSTNSQGVFLIAAASGQLLEFKKPGYKMARVRIPHGYVPSYFKIIMKRGLPEISKDAYANHSNRYDYRSDSLKFRELYKHELDFPKMSAIDMVAHPFSAISGRNREIWQFQETFDEFEKDRYVDMTFNKDLIGRITGLAADSLNNYMRRYRPTYEQLRNMNDYTFFSYIKNSVHYFRTPNIGRGAQ
jgi:hypothetical protein